MSKERDVSSLIENLEAFEDRLGVRFNALSAWCESHHDQYELFVGGEIHAQDGIFIKDSIQIVADAYNSSGQLLKTDSHQVDSLAFFGFETFMIWIQCLPSEKLGRIRVYPKPA
jgi:hypothetical protein